MTDWRAVAKAQQIGWKSTTRTLPREAREDGPYYFTTDGRERGRRYPHCLPRRFAAYNLFVGVRNEALAQFHDFEITWNSATPKAGLHADDDGPTTSLLSSQVQCINSLLSLEMQPDLLLDRLQTFEPSAQKIVPIRRTRLDGAKGLVAFEWIGWENYLQEPARGVRKPGSGVTSADALIVVDCEDGYRTGVLVEWKFTESYNKPIPFITSAGTDRREIYRARYEDVSSPFVANKPPIEAYFHEPHYQLLRQVLLAQGMLQARENGVDRMIALDLVPNANRTLMDCVPEALKPYGNTVDTVWKNLVSGPDVRFVWQDTRPWLTATPELTERYGGLFDS